MPVTVWVSLLIVAGAWTMLPPEPGSISGPMSHAIASPISRTFSAGKTMKASPSVCDGPNQ